jgi:putative tricarboxylic transport membrane protein
MSLGEFYSPGPGLYPFTLGLFLFLISSYFLVRTLIKERGRNAIIKGGVVQTSLKKISYILASLFVYAVLLEKLGYLISTTLLLIGLFASMGSKRWVSIIVTSALAVLVTYFSFALLGVRFPAGILKVM